MRFYAAAPVVAALVVAAAAAAAAADAAAAATTAAEVPVLVEGKHPPAHAAPADSPQATATCSFGGKGQHAATATDTVGVDPYAETLTCNPPTEVGAGTVSLDQEPAAGYVDAQVFK